MIRWIIFAGFYFLLCFYGFQSIKTITKTSWFYYLFILIAVLVVGNFIFQFTSSPSRPLTSAKSYAIGFLLAFVVFNLVIVPIFQIALGLAAIPFGAMLYGMYRGKYNYKVLRYTLHFEDLPEAFDGYKITQISDIHSGSFDNKEKVE